MKAYEIFEKPDTWTRGTFARDAHGNLVEPEDRHACQFCLMGAIWKVYPEGPSRSEALTRATRVLYGRVPALPTRQAGYSCLSGFNDHIAQSQSEIHALLREADV